jgi:hypothetical protein
MRKVRLLADLTMPEGALPSGTELVVDAVEAKLLLGARGLVEDLGEAEPAAAEGAGGVGGATGADAAGAAGDDGEGADTAAVEGDKPRRRAR